MKHVLINPVTRFKPTKPKQNIDNEFVSKIAFDKIINEKQQVEWAMAKSLLDEFDNENGEIRNGMRGLVSFAIEKIQEIWEAKGEAAIQLAYYKDAVNNYKFVKTNQEIFKSHEDFYNQLIDPEFVDGLNTSDLGNLIRFYGEVIEAGEHLGTKSSSEGYDYIRKPEWDKDKGGRLNIPVQKHYLQKSFLEKLKEKASFKSRVGKMKSYQRFGKDDPFTEHKDEGYWNKREGGFRRRQEVRKMKEEELEAIRKKNTAVERALIAEKGGISLFVQLPEDLLNKIDLVFGLSHGATISGTTTDTLFFINNMSHVDGYLKEISKSENNLSPAEQAYSEGWDYLSYKAGKGKVIVVRDDDDNVISETPYIPDPNRGEYSHYGFYGVDPVYYMLPLGTIAGGAHHTTTEVALPLSINLNYDAKGDLKKPDDQLFNYSIGRYQGLFPKRGKARELTGGQRSDKRQFDRIQHILATAEKDHRNRLILIYYDKKEPRGYVEFNSTDSADLKIWNELAKADKNLMSKFKGFEPYPTKENIASLHPAVNMLLFGGRKEQVKTGAQENIVEKMKREHEQKIKDAAPH